MTSVQIYTDGACSGNPGPGGYGALLMSLGHTRELSAGYRLTTNNRMELMGPIAALSALKRPCKVELCSDSKYVVDSMQNGWVLRWKQTGWKKKENRDLWTRILDLDCLHDITFVWVKGHSTNPHNNRCDELAVTACKSADLATDEGYEAAQQRKNAQSMLFDL